VVACRIPPTRNSTHLWGVDGNGVALLQEKGAEGAAGVVFAAVIANLPMFGLGRRGRARRGS
jgi:hypothetical protein